MVVDSFADGLSTWHPLFDTIPGERVPHRFGVSFNLIPVNRPAVRFIATTERGPCEEIKIRHIQNCMKADPSYPEGVANALEIPLSEISQNG